MRGYLLISILSLALGVSASFAADNSFAVSNVAQPGSLMCFSIPATRGGPPSCDAVCQAKGAACVGLKMRGGAQNPGIGCDDAKLREEVGYLVASCRCCAVAH